MLVTKATAKPTCSVTRTMRRSIPYLRPPIASPTRLGSVGQPVHEVGEECEELHQQAIGRERRDADSSPVAMKESITACKRSVRMRRYFPTWK